MKKYLIFVSILLIFLSFWSEASNVKNIKLAVFDNPQIEPGNHALSKKLENAYMQGILTAVDAGKEKKINIQLKEFFYGNGLLDIFQKAPLVNEWAPDVVIGLNSSNSLLASNSFFSDKLVLSISASALELSKLPRNFYSLGTTDLYAVENLVKFIDQHYPNKNLFLVVGAESKESLGIAKLLTEKYKEKNPNLSVRQSRFLSDDLNTMNVKSLMKDYHAGDIIILFSITGTYNIQVNLMNEISRYFTSDKLVFITAIDNWQGRNLTASIDNTNNPYVAYRLDTLYVDINSPEYLEFVKIFRALYHAEPTETISYITYRAVMSIISALEEYPPPKNLETQEAILWSYQKALKKDPNWFRLTELGVFQLKGSKEVYFASLK